MSPEQCDELVDGINGFLERMAEVEAGRAQDAPQ
jgi:hypothetical protein